MLRTRRSPTCEQGTDGREVSRRVRARRVLLACGFLLVFSSTHAAETGPITAWLDAKKVLVGQRTQLIVRLVNDAAVPVAQVQIAVTPKSLIKDAASITAFTVPAKAVIQREFEIQPEQIGVFNVGAVVTIAGHPLPRIDAGALEVTEAPNRFAPYRDVVPVVAAFVALIGSLVALIFTVRNQKQILHETRRQKAAETVSQIVLQVARDYYGAIGGAVSGLASATRRLQAEVTAEEREHLLVRSFFFFGTVVHKDNEFSFGQGLLFLPDLWAEADMRRMIDEVLELVPLTQAQEAVVHKCFSDMAVLQRGENSSAVTLKARNLYELEKLLLDRFANIREDHRRVLEVFNEVKGRFATPEAATLVQDIERAMRGLMEYEFTIMFADFYRGRQPKGTWRSRFRIWQETRRNARAAPYGDRPKTLLAFDEIVRAPSWQEVSGILEQIEVRRAEKEARARAG
jgi:hypothetical protein